MDRKDFRRKKQNGLFCHCIIMLVLVIIVYWKYLSGQKMYVFTDVASDSVGQTFPNLVYLAREISHGNIGNRWNFISSIGNSAEMIIPKLANLEAFFGADHVAYVMGLIMAVKVFLAGIFFYLYLRKMEISDITSSIFSIFYAFCAHMIIRGSWRAYPNEVLTLAIWLYAFEAWYCNRKNWWGLILASAFLYINSSGYYIVLYTGIFVVYAVFRAISDWDSIENGKKVKRSLVFTGCILCALLMSAMGWLSSITTQLKSDRLSNGTQKAGAYNIASVLTDFATLKTAFYRTIGMDLLNINDYCGTSNFLEAPAFYCGLLTLLVLPAIFVQTKGKRKAAYSIGVIGIIIYILVRPVRFLANGFSGHAFKLSSLWVMVLLLHITANGFDEFLEIKENIKIKQVFVIGTGIAAAAVIFVIDGMNYVKLGITLGFLLVYIVMFVYYKYKNISVIQVKGIILMVAAAEVLFASYGCVNNRKTMDENLYEDGTMAALDLIDDKNGNKADFYRIDKQYQAYAFCDSLYQNYMGTTAYIGGSGDRKSTGNFYQAVAMPVFGGNNHNMTGFSTSTKINTLMNVKYILTQTDMNANFGYEQIDRTDGIFIYENMYTLPLGYVYDKYMSLDNYLKLNIEDRRNALLELCVLGETGNHAGLTEAMPEADVLDCQPYEVNAEVELTENWLKIDLPESVEENANLVVLDVESSDTNSSMMEYYNQDGDAVTTYVRFADGRDDYYLEFNDPQIKQVQIFGTNQYDVKQIKVYQVPKNLYYEDYINKCTELKKNGLQVEEMDSNKIYGTINSNKDGMMTFSIPYDTNWHVYIDDIEKELQPVNIGMMGTTITQGTHDIKLIYYKENSWGKYVLAGIVLFIVYSVFAFLLPFSRNKKDNKFKF